MISDGMRYFFLIFSFKNILKEKQIHACAGEGDCSIAGCDLDWQGNANRGTSDVRWVRVGNTLMARGQRVS